MENLKDVSIHQELMNKAYDNWEKNKQWSYNQFISSLDFKEKLAVLTGNLNYQVENGGFSQWHFNDYSSEADELIKLLSMYSNEPVIKRVLSLVEEAVQIINGYELDIEQLKSNWEENEDEINSLEGRMYEALDLLDEQYYQINNEFMNVMEKILKNLTKND